MNDNDEAPPTVDVLMGARARVLAALGETMSHRTAVTVLVGILAEISVESQMSPSKASRVVTEMMTGVMSNLHASRGRLQ